MKNNPKLILPGDVVICEDSEGKGNVKTVPVENIPEGWIGLDLGEKTIKDYRKKLKNAKTVIWNGPLGKFEIEKFNNSSLNIAEFLVKNKKKVIIGGGDTLKALEKYKNKFYYASTGGGSFLSYLSGEEMPALKALDENEVEFFL
jgi:phosphoglycerate kinase